MIVMLGHSEVDMRVLDAGIKTAESNDCREVSRDDRDANDMLAETQEEARFSCKNRWKFIDLFTQSISRLCWVSQLYQVPKSRKNQAE